MRRGALFAAALAATACAFPAQAPGHGPPAASGGAAGGWLAPPKAAAECPTAVDPARFASVEELYRANAVMEDFGERPTGSPNHRRFISYVRSRLDALPGVQVDAVPYPIERWTLKRVALEVRGAQGAERVRVAGPVPYAKAAPRRGVAGQLAYVPADQPLAEADVKDKIVIRDAVTVSVPNAALAALSWFSYDPDLVLAKTVAGTYERENAGQARIDDMQAAAKGGAKGVIFVHGFPHEQKRGQYAPYEGLIWPLPSIMLGVDEGERLKALAAKRGSARINLDADVKPVKTYMLIATLPGLSDEKIGVQSHTDGVNALWDNGPIAMLAMADWFARMGKECRPRTLQFAFTTAHLYQHLVAPDRDGSSEQFAKRMDAEYDAGKVALVLPMEHMGARSWTPVAREAGEPGRVLVPGEHNEPTSVFIGESPALIETMAQTVAEHDLRETIALRGADLPGLQIPPHENFGGEGIPYQHHLIPTISLVSGPWTLFDPDFTLERLVDKDLLHKQTLVFTDLVHKTSTVPREVLGGGYVGYRQARALTCGTALEALGLVRRCNGP